MFPDAWFMEFDDAVSMLCEIVRFMLVPEVGVVPGYVIEGATDDEGNFLVDRMVKLE